LRGDADVAASADAAEHVGAARLSAWFVICNL